MIQALFQEAKSYLRYMPFKGKAYYCPVCNKQSKFFGKAGVIPRANARCMFCGSLERHRLIWLFFERKTNLFESGSLNMLHVAPEGCFERRLIQKIGDGYLTADLFDPGAMVKMDIMDIQYPDNTFDAIYCSHVLEHVPDDKQAIREFYRVLKPRGWAILLVPITVKETFEDPSVTNPSERKRLFGQVDHVRRYGPDYVERLKDGGFYVETIYPMDFLSSNEIKLMGITEHAGEIYYCKKD